MSFLNWRQTDPRAQRGVPKHRRAGGKPDQLFLNLMINAAQA